MEGSEAHQEGSEELPVGFEGLPEGLPEGLGGRMYGRIDGVSPHSTGLHPLLELSPCYHLRHNKIKEAGQGNLWRLV